MGVYYNGVSRAKNGPFWFFKCNGVNVLFRQDIISLYCPVNAPISLTGVSTLSDQMDWKKE